MLFRGERRIEKFRATLRNPKLWWPRNKGPQNLYTAKFSVDGESFDAWDWDAEGHKKTIKVPRAASHALACRFGIREACSKQSGKEIVSTFYWWSNSGYSEGKREEAVGSCAGGFEELVNLPRTTLRPSGRRRVKMVNCDNFAK